MYLRKTAKKIKIDEIKKKILINKLKERIRKNE